MFKTFNEISRLKWYILYRSL